MAIIPFLIIFTCYGIFFSTSESPEANKAIIDIVSSFGCKIQFHEVITSDGYILGIHRISKNNVERNDVALMMHGLEGSSVDWVITGNRSLVSTLVNKGYDVWLGNNRGNTYSKDYLTNFVSRSTYSNFSWHEFGIYDLPAIIDYILKVTGQKNLLYTCFSQGCTQAFVMGSLKPEYNKKIKFALALAPAAYTTHVKGILTILAHYLDTITAILERRGHFIVFSNSGLIKGLSKLICNRLSPLQRLCILGIFSLAGYSAKIDRQKLPCYMAHMPAGASSKQFIHYAFGTKYPGTFRQYDYGPLRNLEFYNSTTPPEYPLENVNFPIAIYHGENDFLTTPMDMNLLAKRLPNVVDHVLIGAPNVNHFSLIYNSDVFQFAFNRAMRILENSLNQDSS